MVALGFHIHIVNLFNQPIAQSREELVGGTIKVITWTWEPLGGSQEQEAAKLGVKGGETLRVGMQKRLKIAAREIHTRNVCGSRF